MLTKPVYGGGIEFCLGYILSVGQMGLISALFLGLSLALSQNASAELDANPVGKVVVVAGTVRIEHPAAVLVQANLPTDVVQAKVGDFVYHGDVIQTGPDGTLGVAFADESSLSFSPNARMEIKEFVYDPHGHFNSSLISLTKGTFTLIAGKIANTGNMTVATPVGTLRIRDVAPRIEILKDGSVKFSTLVDVK